MQNFEFCNPVRVIYEAGAVNRLGQRAALYGSSAMIVTYQDVSFYGDLPQRMLASLENAGLKAVLYQGATANPTLGQARKGIELCREHGIDVLIGLGGGSATDLTKAIAAGTLYPEEDIRKMFVFSLATGPEVPAREALPMIMIPTVPATGSEMNPTAVLTDETTHEKSYVFEPDCLYPKEAMIDPELLISLPPYQIACGCFDALVHVLESYLNGSGDCLDVQDGLQEGVMRAIWNRLPEAVAQPTQEVLGMMQWASSVALNGWLTCGTYGFTPMHQMGHVLSARYGCTHGATLAVMTLAWMRFYGIHPAPERYRMAAERVFGQTLETLPDWLEGKLKALGIQTRLSDWGIDENDLPSLAADVARISFDATGVLPSVPGMTEKDVLEIYRLAY